MSRLHTSGCECDACFRRDAEERSEALFAAERRAAPIAEAFVSWARNIYGYDYWTAGGAVGVRFMGSQEAMISIDPDGKADLLAVEISRLSNGGSSGAFAFGVARAMCSTWNHYGEQELQGIRAALDAEERDAQSKASRGV